MMTLWLVWAGCSPQEALEVQEALWLQEAHFEWQTFNHRLSAMRYGFAGDEAELAVVGGTSTTGRVDPLEQECDPDGCSEFPFLDPADVRLGWGRLVTDQAALGTATVALDVTADGATATVDVPLPASPRGEVTAILTGFSLDTDRPLTGGEACYRPAYGWHPRQLGITLGEIALARATDTATVEVTARFAAGPSFEAIRACIDEVVGEAVVGMTVDLLVLAGVDEVVEHEVRSEAAYELGEGGRRDPDTQRPPRPAPLESTAPVMGWSRVDFAFDSAQNASEDGRGSYLRTLGFALGDDGAVGVATNFSPPTQLTGFAYAFEGTVRAIDVAGEVETGTVVVEGLRPDLDEAGRPVVHAVAR